MIIGLFACSNGLGHTRRVVSISAFMLQNGFDGKIEAHLSFEHLKRLSKWDQCNLFINHPNVTIKNFCYPLQYKAKTNELFSKDWNNFKLPSLDKYDVVWSDNILQILKYRHDVKLTGSFFWHEVFTKNHSEPEIVDFVLEQEAILTQTRPLMAGSEYFATPAVKQQTIFVPVGLYRYTNLVDIKNGTGILLSCGLGGEEEEMARLAIRKIIKENIRPPSILYVEPMILPKIYPDWIKPADFSARMYHECLCVCARPGMGTVSDALVTRNFFFAFYNKGSFEMNHNTKVLVNMGLGKMCHNAFNAYLDALQYIKSKDKVQQHLNKTLHLRTDGVYATANFILGK